MITLYHVLEGQYTSQLLFERLWFCTRRGGLLGQTGLLCPPTFIFRPSWTTKFFVKQLEKMRFQIEIFTFTCWKLSWDLSSLVVCQVNKACKTNFHSFFSSTPSKNSNFYIHCEVFFLRKCFFMPEKWRGRIYFSVQVCLSTLSRIMLLCVKRSDLCSICSFFSTFGFEVWWHNLLVCSKISPVLGSHSKVHIHWKCG